MITRGDVAGALKVLNATGSRDRRGALKAMLGKEHGPRDVERALADLESYPEWSAGAHLDPAAPPPASAPAAGREAKRASKRRKK